MKDDPSKITKLTAPTMTWYSPNYLATIFLQSKKMSWSLLNNKCLIVLCLTYPSLASLISQDYQSFYSTWWNRLSFPVRQRLPVDYRCNAETKGTICTARSVHFLLTTRQSDFLFAQTHQGRRGTTRQGSRLGGSKQTRVLPCVFFFFVITIMSWVKGKMYPPQQKLRIPHKRKHTLWHLEMVAKIFEIFNRNSYKPKDSRNTCFEEKKIYSTFWESLCCLQLTFGNDALVDHI